jgi:3-hydroxy acid dehydrogenase / malonic semialdehyde reductase
MTLNGNGKVAVITGASSGIGRASAIALSEAGFQLALGARRIEKLELLADEVLHSTGKRPFVARLDVTDLHSCEQFISQVAEKYGKIHLLLNNAGMARGTAHVADVVSDDDWQIMVDTNVMGLLRMTRLAIPYILESQDGHIMNLGSVAGREAYSGGAVYCATKFAERAITDALRQELLGKPVRVTTIDPGMVETEFSVIRYYGDTEKADAVYANMQPLTAEDIADTIVFAATRPSHVNIDAVIIKPRDQAGAGKVARHQ